MCVPFSHIRRRTGQDTVHARGSKNGVTRQCSQTAYTSTDDAGKEHALRGTSSYLDRMHGTGD